MIDEHLRPVRNPEYLCEEMDGELLLYHPKRTRSIFLNDTARLIWNLCDGQRTVSELSALLVDNYPEGIKVIPEDIVAALRQLKDFGAISSI